MKSIFNGNFKPGDEVIVVNDRSTDDTSAVVEAISREHTKKIKLVTNEQNKGCPASRNVGIRESKNSLIFNLDADNVLAPNSIQALREAIAKTGADVAAFAEYHYFIDSTKKITHKWICQPEWFTLADLFSGHINPGPGGNFLYTKASWERIGGYWEYGKGLHEAWGFTLKQLASSSRFYVVPQTYYFHRHGHESLFVSESRNKTGEVELLQKMLVPYEPLFPPEEWTYIQNNPAWYHNLESRPIKLKTGQIGKNGTHKLTLYGLYMKVKNKLGL